MSERFDPPDENAHAPWRRREAPRFKTNAVAAEPGELLARFILEHVSNDGFVVTMDNGTMLHMLGMAEDVVKHYQARRDATMSPETQTLDYFYRLAQGYNESLTMAMNALLTEFYISVQDTGLIEPYYDPATTCSSTEDEWEVFDH